MAVSLPEKVLVKLEAIVWRVTENSAEEVRGSRRSSMHVQSHSEWAPANIGPYSQAYTVSLMVCVCVYTKMDQRGNTGTLPLSLYQLGRGGGSGTPIHTLSRSSHLYGFISIYFYGSLTFNNN